MTLPAGLVRLGTALPSEVHAEARLLGRCAPSRVRMPSGAVLLEGHEDLGPVARGEHVVLRVLGTRPAVRVPTDRAAVLAAGVRTVRLAAPTGARRDVLVLRSVTSVHAGRARTGGRYDRIQAVEGEAHELDADGEVRVLDAPRLERSWHRAHRGVDEWRTPLPPWAMRVSGLLRDVRQVLGQDPLEIMWADDGQVCRLLGVVPRPIEEHQ